MLRWTIEFLIVHVYEARIQSILLSNETKFTWKIKKKKENLRFSPIFSFVFILVQHIDVDRLNLSMISIRWAAMTFTIVLNVPFSLEFGLLLLMLFKSIGLNNNNLQFEEKKFPLKIQNFTFEITNVATPHSIIISKLLVSDTIIQRFNGKEFFVHDLNDVYQFWGDFYNDAKVLLSMIIFEFCDFDRAFG